MSCCCKKSHFHSFSLKKSKTKEELLAKVAPYLGKDRGLDRLIYRLEGVEDGESVEVKREIVKRFSQHLMTPQ